MIIKKFNLGHIAVEIRIVESLAILTTNQPGAAKQMYEFAVKGKQTNIFYNERTNAFIQKFPGKTEKEIEQMLSQDIDKTLPEEMNKAKEYARKVKEKNDKH